MNGDVQGLIREASTLEDQENDSSSGKDRFLVSHFYFSSKDQTALLPLLEVRYCLSSNQSNALILFGIFAVLVGPLFLEKINRR